jgi:hypothetical protein
MHAPAAAAHNNAGRIDLRIMCPLIMHLRICRQQLQQEYGCSNNIGVVWLGSMWVGTRRLAYTH